MKEIHEEVYKEAASKCLIDTVTLPTDCWLQELVNVLTKCRIKEQSVNQMLAIYNCCVIFAMSAYKRL